MVKPRPWSAVPMKTKVLIITFAVGYFPFMWWFSHALEALWIIFMFACSIIMIVKSYYEGKGGVWVAGWITLILTTISFAGYLAQQAMK